MKIVDLKKFIKSVVIILLLIFCFSLIFTKASLSHKEIEYKSVYVQKGDTLWTIAEDLQSTNDYYKNKDIRDIIYNIKEINNLSSSNISINQELLIPTI